MGMSIMNIAGGLVTVSQAAVTEVNYALWRSEGKAQVFTNAEANVRLSIGDLKWVLTFGEVNIANNANACSPYFELCSMSCLGALYHTDKADVSEYMAEFRDRAKTEGLAGLSDKDILNLHELLHSLTPTNDSLGVEYNAANFTYEIEVDGSCDYIEKAWCELKDDDVVSGMFASYAAPSWAVMKNEVSI